MQVHEISVRLSSSLESDQLAGFYTIIDALRELESSELKSSGANLIMNTETVFDVLHTAREAPTEQIRELAIECIALMSCRPTLRAQMVAAGVIPLLLELLQLREPALSAIESEWSLDAIERIAKASRVNCDALLASGALAVLLPLVRSNIPAALGERLLSALACLMRGKPAAEMGAVVSRIGSVLMDRTSPPEILRACINTFGQALEGCASEDPTWNSWTESILSAAPGFPQRLVELLGDARPDVAEISQNLMISVFRAETDQLRQLFDCGLADQLLSLLNHAVNRKARLRIAVLFTNATATKACALLLVDSAAVMERLLALLSTLEGHTFRQVVNIFCNMTAHRDRHITRRLVEEHRALPPLVAALRRAIQTADQAATHLCLCAVDNVLVMGATEAEDDERGVNPYIEPIDWLGAFELADPMQSSADEEVAENARDVFSYFIPNDCD